ncbi:uncharacterized protein LOC129869869 [Solanum dulcamara]|uniref:uncharacterized protein LOC129869869 n=1 Tax=Solanum dulcamara TaxID=45834 RepID=UPI002486973E|nr:uncharacterized protein LOC129869869 [Solanum dulcamara]
MDLKGKLIASIEVNCGGHPIHDTIYINTHHIPNIAPKVFNHFEIHMKVKLERLVRLLAGKLTKVTHTVILSLSPSIFLHQIFVGISYKNTPKLYEHQWTTITFMYEKKTEDTNGPITYLGCPLYIGRQRIIYYTGMVSKVIRKIRGWQNKILSFGGRATLVKSVLQSLPIHLLSAIRPTATTINQIKSLIANFFWGWDKEKKKYH